jgi:hypothetical protein
LADAQSPLPNLRLPGQLNIKITYNFSFIFPRFNQIPLVLISVLNTRILVSLHCSARVQCVGHRRRMAKERRSVWLLISIVLLFFLCHTGESIDSI